MSFHKSILENSIFRPLTVISILLLVGGLITSAGHAFLLLFLAILIIAIYALSHYFMKNMWMTFGGFSYTKTAASGPGGYQFN